MKATAADVLPPAKPKSEPVAFSQDDFKNDPLIQKALEVFKGRNVEVWPSGFIYNSFIS